MIKISPFIKNIEDLTLRNKYFRNVIYTSSNLQLVLMTLLPGQEIGTEIHKNVDQFFRIESGKGQIIIGRDSYVIGDGAAIIVPKNTIHNIINIGDEPLKLYTIYSPPQHKNGMIVK
jgi:mannose-6-phosphate isomerase-like protein (cupin superfamily)